MAPELTRLEIEFLVVDKGGALESSSTTSEAASDPDTVSESDSDS